MKRFTFALMICSLFAFTSLAAHPCEAKTDKDVELTTSWQHETVAIDVVDFTFVTAGFNYCELQSSVVIEFPALPKAELNSNENVTATYVNLFDLSGFRHTGHEHIRAGSKTIVSNYQKTAIALLLISDKQSSRFSPSSYACWRC